MLERRTGRGGAGLKERVLTAGREAVHTASSGAGAAAHFVDVFKATSCEAALAAGICHRREVAISSVKTTLADAGIPVRLV